MVQTSAFRRRLKDLPLYLQQIQKWLSFGNLKSKLENTKYKKKDVISHKRVDF